MATKEQKLKWDNIPSELKELNNWVCWSGEKLPKNPHTGKNAKSNDPNTWSDFKTAVDAVDKYKFNGIGFMFSQGYFGVDLDNSSDELNEEFITTLKSYAEYSKSGNGIHIICKGNLPKGRRRKGDIEMYDGGRYFIMTGNSISDYPIRDGTESIKPLHKKYLDHEQKQKVAIDNHQPVSLQDDEVIEKARNSKNGMLFQVLFSGNWESFYPSQSEADMAFVNMLAFWTGRNKEQMDRIYRSSNLMRDKWDREQSGSTYGEITLLKAIQETQTVYSPNRTQNYFVNKDGEVVSKPDKEYEPNDTGNAQRLVDKFGDLIKYNYDDKIWMIWNGSRWKYDNTGEIKRLAENVVEEMKSEAFLEEDKEKRKALIKNVNRAFSSSGKEAMIKEATHKAGIPCTNNDFDNDKELINFQNGVFNLKNGELIEHNPEYYQTKITGTEYKEGKPTKWMKFLNEITNGDTDLQKFIQKSIGYSLTGDVSEQVIFFCYGTGQNGKSVFLDVVNALMGRYTAHAQPETIMYSRNQGTGATSDIARLKGARFVTTTEPNEGVRLNEGLIKQLTGGDKVTARHLYGKEFEFYPEFKLWLATNHKPIIRGTDEGIWRRIRLIPFTVRIPDEKIDKHLSDKLIKELPYIAHWAFRGVLKWRKEGLGTAESVDNATNEYRDEMDVINNFLQEETYELVGAREKATKIFKIYKEWAQTNNEYLMSSTRFGKELSSRFDRKRLSDGTYYLDVKLRRVSIGE